MRPNRALWASLAVGALLLWVPSSPQAQGADSSDAGTGGDASDTQGGATRLPEVSNQVPRSNFYSGHLGAGTDVNDWYRFGVTTSGLLLEITLVSEGTRDFDMGLHRSVEGGAVATGVGSNGGRQIRYTSDLDTDDWVLHVFVNEDRGGTGRYHFSVSVLNQNDGGQGRDAPNVDASALPLLAVPGSSVTAEGLLTEGDSGDRYKFTTFQNVPVLVSLVFPTSAGADFDFSITPPSMSLPLVTERSGPGFRTILHEGSLAGTYFVTVTGSSGPYVLGVRVAPTLNGDLSSGEDSPNDRNTGLVLPEGLHVSVLDPQDTSDWYRLTNVAVGDVLRIGASSHESDAALNRPFVHMRLENPSRTVIASFDVCGDARGLTWTAPVSGTWFLQVSDAGAACGPAVDRTGGYAVFYDRSPQSDPGGQDAPSSVASAPSVGLGTLQTAWLDPGDTFDAFRIGAIDSGEVFRFFIGTMSPDQEFQVTLFRDNSVLVGSPIQSEDGAVKLQTAAAVSGTYRVQIQGLGPDASGPYRFWARVFPDEPPQPVSLSNPSSVGRTALTLRWSQAIDLDFGRYEVHQSQDSSFTPSAATAIANFTDLETTTHRVEGLRSGQTYTFLIRVVDFAGLGADSNRRTVTTSSLILTNNPPTLSQGSVVPAEGDTSTMFTFSVVYDDNDNDTPSVARVVISGVPHNMTTDDTSYHDSSRFRFQSTLPGAEHTFFFEFNDGTSTVRDPAVGENEGPVVTQGGNRPPTVTASANPTQGQAPLTVRFSAEASDPEDDSLSYSWDFDNSDGIQTQSGLQNPNHTYQEPGTFTATVHVTDERGATSTDSVTVDVTAPQNAPPTVSPTADPSSGLVPLAVQFAANAQDPDGSIASVSWDFDNADGIQPDSTQAAPSHTYTSPGTYTATVTATDNNGTSTTGSVTVTARSPTNNPPSVSIQVSSDRGEAPLEVQFSALAVDPDGELLTISWDFDQSDGVQEEATGASVTHTFRSPGTFVVTAKVIDAQGATGTATREVQVLTPAHLAAVPLVILFEPVDERNPLNVTFRAEFQSEEVFIDSYHWDFGDGSTATGGPTVSHAYERGGRYHVVLTVTDEFGGEYQATRDVDISAPQDGGIGPMVLALLIMGGLAVLAVVGFVVYRLRA